MEALLKIEFITIVHIIIIYYIVNKFKKEKLKQKEIIKAEECAKLKTDFIVNLSHELRTPINIILGTTDILENNIKEENINIEDISRKLENIKNNSYRLLKISNNIIDITKADCGMLKLQIENCNIVRLIEDTFTSAIDYASRKNIEMIFDTEVEELITAIDIFQIQRVVLNLISNAIKSTYEGGKIEVFIANHKNEVAITVKDNGVGIAEDKINCIFHRFYQGDDVLTRVSEGSGIGLCISKNLVKIHNGRIEVKSKEGKGSEFTVYLPIKIINEYEKFDNTKILRINNNVDLELSDI